MGVKYPLGECMECGATIPTSISFCSDECQAAFDNRRARMKRKLGHVARLLQGVLVELDAAPRHPSPDMRVIQDKIDLIRDR